ncbi:PTS system fructose-specific transporter subunit [Listeria monocytogenes]|nr:PTS system fructose-specific transporter subunit [Listeria monocytogenes]GAT39938.1 PTS system fructose-specific transporter subunit [Listeria monocytogenes]GAT42114.1 PTS system fructose-specific transporter subunit [Listeria monocytogenes]
MVDPPYFSSINASAALITFSASLIGALTGTSSTTLPSKRSLLRTFVSTAKITTSPIFTSFSVNSFSIPVAPCVSTLMRLPIFFAPFLSACAAIYVCATPVAHAVTAIILRFISLLRLHLKFE